MFYTLMLAFSFDSSMFQCCIFSFLGIFIGLANNKWSTCYGFLGCYNEDHIIFSTRASSYLRPLCKWCDLKCYASSAWFLWGHINIWGGAFLSLVIFISLCSCSRASWCQFAWLVFLLVVVLEHLGAHFHDRHSCCFFLHPPIQVFKLNPSFRQFSRPWTSNFSLGGFSFTASC